MKLTELSMLIDICLTLILAIDDTTKFMSIDEKYGVGWGIIATKTFALIIMSCYQLYEILKFMRRCYVNLKQKCERKNRVRPFGRKLSPRERMILDDFEATNGGNNSLTSDTGIEMSETTKKPGSRVCLFGGNQPFSIDLFGSEFLREKIPSDNSATHDKKSPKIQDKEGSEIQKILKKSRHRLLKVALENTGTSSPSKIDVGKRLSDFL